MSKNSNRYSAIIEEIFKRHYRKKQTSFQFNREELEEIATQLGIKLPKNLGDLIYSFKFRAALPESITKTASSGSEWIIRSAGRSVYQFALVRESRIVPNQKMAMTKILDATPGLIAAYAMNDEQALLAKIRYNRLLDVFTGIACYSLQNHLRTTAKDIGQVEVDEIYVGVDRHGALYVFPVQAKTGRDQIGIVQAEQDIAVCRQRFPDLICRPIATQFLNSSQIAMFELGLQNDEIVIHQERHYQLALPTELTPEEIALYRSRTLGSQ